MCTNQPPWALYIHWPFCLSKCPYCDFNSHVHKTIPVDRFKAAFLQELETQQNRLKRNTPLQSIFFGGGTPSLMPPQLVADLIQKAKQHFYTSDSLEITLEANPTSFEKEKFQAFKEAGVNRLSLGVQSFNDQDLSFLGRGHNAREAEEALEACAALFPRFSFDLMYGLANQTTKDWQQQLQKAAVLKPTHLSCYQLTFEQGTAFYTRFQRGDLKYPNETNAIAFDTQTESVLAEKGLRRYETSNYAAPGFESQHNLAYWKTHPTLGIGPGSHGRPILHTKPYAEQMLRAPFTWLEAVEKQGHGLQKSSILSPEERLQEWFLMGLRLKAGIATEEALRITGQPFATWHKGPLKERLEALCQQDLLCISQEKMRIHTTKKGALRLNGILSFLFAA
ncbi:MAG: radical SAM family heme chaperone HemW [Holosporaceae bacterium]